MLNNQDSLLGTLPKEIADKITQPLNAEESEEIKRLTEEMHALQNELTKLQNSKLTVFVTFGLPASGKTTWALEYIKNNPNTIRVNKDSIRMMLYGEPYRSELEDFVCDIRDRIIHHSLTKGYDVIVDDTNIKKEHRDRIKEIADFYGVKVEIKDFNDVPLVVCIERNAKRENPVPEEAIHRMYAAYLKDVTEKQGE